MKTTKPLSDLECIGYSIFNHLRDNTNYNWSALYFINYFCMCGSSKSSHECPEVLVSVYEDHINITYEEIIMADISISEPRLLDLVVQFCNSERIIENMI